MQLRKLALLPALVLALAAAGATADDKVGTVKFETSCSPVVQAEFERAVAMLHSFWFSASTDAFVVIAQKDPGCAMANRKSTRLNSSHGYISYAVFCLKKKNTPRGSEDPGLERSRPSSRGATGMLSPGI